MIDLTCSLHNNTLSVGTVLVADFCLPTESSRSQFPVRRKQFLKWLNTLCVPGETRSTHFPWRWEAHGEQRFPPWLLKSFSQTPGGAIANPLRRHTEEQRRPVCPHSGTGRLDMTGSFVGAPHCVFTQGTISTGRSWGLLRPPESLCVSHAPPLSL